MLFTTPEPVQASMYTAATNAAPTPPMVVLTATESAGPSSLLNILDDRALQRWDITEGRKGIPVTLAMQLIDLDNHGTAISGAEVYLRHSSSDDAAEATSVLQGVQCTTAAGKVTFKTLYPGSDPTQQQLHMQVLLPNTVPSSRTLTSASTQLHFPPAAGEATQIHLLAPASETLSMSGDAHAGFFASIVIGITSIET